MKDNSNKPNQRPKSIIIARIILTLLLTIRLTNIFMGLSDKVLTNLGNAGSTAAYTQNYGLGLWNYIFAIPAVLISFFVVKAIFYIVSKIVPHTKGKTNSNSDKQEADRILWDTIFPIAAFLLGLLSIDALLGIVTAITALFRHPSTFSSYEELSYHAAGVNPNTAAIEMIFSFMQIDVKILIYLIIAFILHKKCVANRSAREHLAKKGVITAVVCLILSVPLGGVNMIGPAFIYNAVYKSAIDEMLAQERGHYVAKEDDYIISDLEATFYEDFGGYFTASGTITNTTEYDWEYITFNVWFTNVNDIYGHFVKDDDEIPEYPSSGAIATCRIENLPAGGSANFTSSKRFRVYTSDTDYDVKCKIYDINYKTFLDE